MENSIVARLTDTVEMPLVGYGTYLIAPEDTAAAVKKAIEIGYRHIDAAAGYGNEAAVGEGIRAGLAATGMRRDEVFVTTKLWPGAPAWGQEELGYEATLAAFETSREMLDLDYVDLYLIHTPFAEAERVNQWRALVALKESGLVRAIGVSNYRENHLEEIRAAGLPMPDANQIELHPWTQKSDLIAYLRQEAILPIAYSSLAPLSTWRVEEGQDSAKPDAMREEVEQSSPFRAMAAKYGVTEAQLLLRWGVQSGYPVLPRSLNEDRMRQNIEIFGFQIDEEDMELMAKLDRGDGIAWVQGDPSRVG